MKGVKYTSKEQLTKALLEPTLKIENNELYGWIVNNINLGDNKNALNILLSLSSEESPRIKSYIAQIMGQMGQKAIEGVSLLKKYFENEKDFKKKFVFALSLTMIEGQESTSFNYLMELKNSKKLKRWQIDRVNNLVELFSQINKSKKLADIIKEKLLDEEKGKLKQTEDGHFEYLGVKILKSEIEEVFSTLKKEDIELVKKAGQSMQYVYNFYRMAENS